jgi:hypothetical protein
MDFIVILLVLLNYFWLSDDPDECASWYCDQHCFKIGSEVIESIWDPISVLAPELMDLATKQGIGITYRKNRHAPENGLWHPLSVWHGLCMSNMRRGLINARAIFREHEKRTGVVHSAAKDCIFLMKYISLVDFQTPIWKKWYSTQNGSILSKKSEERAKWCSIHARITIHQWGRAGVATIDRNICIMTPPPVLTTPECKIAGDLIGSYKKYYHEKVTTISGNMRYYYTNPPDWLLTSSSSGGHIKTERSKKTKR